jgi:predicted nucleic-acid-binding protein
MAVIPDELTFHRRLLLLLLSTTRVQSCYRYFCGFVTPNRSLFFVDIVIVIVVIVLRHGNCAKLQDMTQALLAERGFVVAESRVLIRMWRIRWIALLNTLRM